MRFFLQSLLPLAVSVAALSVVEPKEGADIDASDSFTVKWTSVSTDPSSFDLYIVNNAVYPPVETKIASDVETSEGSYTVDNVSGITKGHGYQINLLSDSAQNSGILAQSQQFNITGAASSSSSSTSSSSTTSTSSTSTSTSSTGTSTTSTTLTTSGATTKTTSGSSTSAGSATTSSGAASSSGVKANETSSGAASVHTGAGVALAVPLTAGTGLLLAALFFSL
ncbi:hypothetical protein ARAM_001526 [Aspergillus rambellii]|uniref:Yeast cell wall synthesis Kre9/Knh1-like N-terminal domain-containing protein n=2 Tax=Aspergillus subgen. Nidulantes TaxID=2720870 RepID=A0A0F8UWE0_9EURO|nr:hypothetical protein AOCH_003509 [Aspergillus ochraceoroseus]KKK23813.1 hypothetical protein ARAM_001526 [Aspergillus rambellii]